MTDWIVDLTPQDTLASVLARLSTVRAGRVLLRVPRGLRFSVADLHLLRREAAVRGLGLALLTTDVALRRAAGAAGLSTFRSAAWARRLPWRRLRPEADRPLNVATPASVQPPYAPGLLGPRTPSGFRPPAFVRAFARQPWPWLTELGLTVVLLALLAGLLYALATIIPEATVTVTPASEPIQVTVPLVAIQDAAPDVRAGIVPARVLSAQVSGEGRIPTTGRRFEPSAKAKGQVVLINRTSRPLTVPAGTVVATATGVTVRFQTTREAPLAPNGRATVPVEALLPGPSGNVRTGTITRVEGPLAPSLWVANDTNFTGGDLARVGVVTESDKEQLQAKLFEELKVTALERLNQRLEAGSFIPPDSVTYLALAPTFTPFVGEIASELTLNMSVQAVGLAVDAQAAQLIALTRLQDAMPPGTRLISDTVRYIPGAMVVEDSRTVSFTMTASGILLRAVDINGVRQAVLGLAPEAAEAVLLDRFALARPPVIALGPDWLPYIVPINLPSLPWRIRVNVDWDGAAMLAMRR